MTIKELEILAVPDQRAPFRLGMPPAGGVLMARNAMELPPAGVLDFVPSELTPQDDDDDLDELYAKRKDSKTATQVVSKENSSDGQADVTMNNKGFATGKNELYISANVLNRLSESGDARKSKPQKNPLTDVLSSNQQQTTAISTKPRRKEMLARSSSQDRRKSDSCQRKESVESFIRENIAGNNAGHYLSDEILPIQYAATPDGPVLSTIPAPPACAACGEGIPSQPGGVCKQCKHRGKNADLKAGTLDEIIAYAQSLASSVKKMLTITGDPKSGSAVMEPNSLEPSQKLHRHQSELARHRGAASYVMGIDDKQPRKLFEITSSAPSANGDDMDIMSMVDGEVSKESRNYRLEQEASNLTNVESRPTMSRAKTKVKAIFSGSRTKTFRSRMGRTRTDHELRNESVTSTLSTRMDGKRGGIPEPTRKTGRTQTFDSSNLHPRKDAGNRSRHVVMHEGTPVDPPGNDDKVNERALKYSISRSATSPGTPGLKTLQREKSNFGASGPLLRTNTKLTLRANKAAVLRKENIHKATTLFHQQPAVDASDGSPILERKRGNTRNLGDSRMKFKLLDTISERQSPEGVQARDRSQSFTMSVGSGIKQEANATVGHATQQLMGRTDSEIYCGAKAYIDDSKSLNPYHEETPQNMTKQIMIENEGLERNPYCDDLHHYGKGLENQLSQNAVIENRSRLAVTPYFDKGVTNAAKELPKGEGLSLYTDQQIAVPSSQRKPDKCSSSLWYNLQAVTSKSSTQLREATRVRSSLSDVGAARSSLMGLSGSQARRHVKYSETDVDSGTIYHMAKRIASDQKVPPHSEFAAASNFFETGGDVSKSSSSTSGHSSTAPDTEYTGGFFRDTFDESDKKDVSSSPSNVSEHTYFEYEGESKAEPLECDIYTGSVFSPSANSLALSGLGDNWRNKSTNNSNRLPSYRCRSKTTMARINNRRILNCSNNSSSFVERSRSPSVERFGPKVTQSISSSYVDYTGSSRSFVQAVTIPLPDIIDFTKYDNIGLDDTGSFFSSSSKYKSDKDTLYEGKAYGYRKYASAHSESTSSAYSENLYTLGDRNTNVNNCQSDEEGVNSNNNYFGDFYTGDASGKWGVAHQERRTDQASTSAGDFTTSRSPKYASSSFYENAYAEPQSSPPRAQAPPSSFFGIFNGYGEPPAQQAQYSPEYAGSFSPSSGPITETRSRPVGANRYEGYGRTTSASPKRSHYDHDGYFEYHASGSRDDRLDFMESPERSEAPAVPKIRRVGAIVCRENVANKDDYAEDVNRDLMEDPWIPISYRLAAERVKEMGGGRCSSGELFKTTEAKCDPTMLDASPFAQGQMLEALGRKAGGWNLKQNTDSLRDDISMKWRDAREKGNRHHQQQQQDHKSKKGSDSNHNRTITNSVWRPSDQIPAKARGPRTVVKSENRMDKDGANKNNSNPSDSTDVITGRQENKTHQSAIARPKVPGKSKPTRATRKGKRALYPSKAVIEYPKVKLRRPLPPAPSPPKLDVTTTVVRGKDTLLISICKNPEKCVVEPHAIDSRVNPFQQISLAINQDLDDEVEAERAQSYPKPTPLNCFNPPKWSILNEESVIEKPTGKPMEKPMEELLVAETLNLQQDKSSRNSTVKKAGQTQGEPGAIEGKKGAEPKPEYDTAYIHEENETAAISTGGRKEGLLGDQANSKPNKKRGKRGEAGAKPNDSENESVVGGTIQEEEERQEMNFATAVNRRYTRASNKQDDEKATELINKYLSKQPQAHDRVEQAEEDEGEDYDEWPYLRPGITKENRATYVMLSQQLNDGRRLMDMPVRKRGKRLWKLAYARWNSMSRGGSNHD